MCNLNKELLHEYIDGELNQVEALLLEEHLKTCPECSRELNQLKILDWNFRFSDNIKIPQDELSDLRMNTLNRCFAEIETTSVDKENSLSDVYKIQTASLKYAVNYMNFLPGADLIKSVSKSTRTYLGKKLDIRKIISG